MQIKCEISIDHRLCKACGICVDLCPKSVLVRAELGKAEVKDIEKCIGCMLCEYRCPDYAIRVRRIE